MVYGYDCRTINEYGLKQLREISLAVSPNDLRSLAEFLKDTANELEQATSGHWHRHVPDALRRNIGCDVIILNIERNELGGELG
jgi:hypothetical protein